MMSLVRAQLGEPRKAVGFISYSFFVEIIDKIKKSEKSLLLDYYDDKTQNEKHKMQMEKCASFSNLHTLFYILYFINLLKL